jgi:hypothetical protein
MKRMSTKKLRSIAATTAAVLLLGACSGSMTGARLKRSGNNDSSPNLSEGDLKEQKISFVSAFDLDNSELRVNGIRASVQDFMTGETPVLTYMLPEKADYVEIMRCSADTIIRGPSGDLLDVDLGSPSLDDEKRIFKQNNFWDSALEQINNCVLVSSGFSNSIYQDLHIVSGSYRYLVRACVSPQRLTDAEFVSHRHCSRQIGLSTLLANYKNQRNETESAALQRVQDFRDRADGLGREIHYLAVATNNALAACNDRETARQIRVKRKEAFTTIMGFGLSLGLELSLPSTGLSAVRSGAKTWTQLWGETWNNRDTIAGQCTQIGQALQWLFSSPEDFPRSCTRAKELAMQADIKTDELKNVSKELAEAADEVEVARKNKAPFQEGK